MLTNLRFLPILLVFFSFQTFAQIQTCGATLDQTNAETSLIINLPSLDRPPSLPPADQPVCVNIFFHIVTNDGVGGFDENELYLIMDKLNEEFPNEKFI